MNKDNLNPKVKINAISTNIKRVIYIAKQDIKQFTQICLSIDKKIKDIIKNDT